VFESNFYLDRRRCQCSAGIGENSSASRFERQRCRRVTLQRTDLLRHRRRCDMQSRSDRCNTAPVSQLTEGTQLTKFHKFKLNYLAQN
jgi:hypothetical protein